MLLLDEPASNLDHAWQEVLVDLVGEVQETTGITVMIVTHDLSLLPACCGRVMVLAGGRLKGDGPPAEILVPPVLSELYGSAVKVEWRDGRYYVFPARLTGAPPEDA